MFTATNFHTGSFGGHKWPFFVQKKAFLAEKCIFGSKNYYFFVKKCHFLIKKCPKSTKIHAYCYKLSYWTIWRPFGQKNPYPPLTPQNGPLCNSSSIPRFLTDGRTHGATLGQSRAGQGRPHGNLTEPPGYSIGPNWEVIEPLWKFKPNQTMPNQTKPNFTKMDITRSFLKLQAPDFAW